MMAAEVRAALDAAAQLAATEAATKTWSCIAAEVLSSARPGWSITLPIHVVGLGLEQVEAFAAELLRRAQQDPAAWSAWSVIRFEINGAAVGEVERDA